MMILYIKTVIIIIIIIMISTFNCWQLYIENVLFN